MTYSHKVITDSISYRHMHTWMSFEFLLPAWWAWCRHPLAAGCGSWLSDTPNAWTTWVQVLWAASQCGVPCDALTQAHWIYDVIEPENEHREIHMWGRKNCAASTWCGWWIFSVEEHSTKVTLQIIDLLNSVFYQRCHELLVDNPCCLAPVRPRLRHPCAEAPASRTGRAGSGGGSNEHRCVGWKPVVWSNFQALTSLGVNAPELYRAISDKAMQCLQASGTGVDWLDPTWHLERLPVVVRERERCSTRPCCRQKLVNGHW